MIDITGYVTKTGSENGFTIKVTSDKIEYQPYSDIYVSEEVEVRIDKHLYPSDIANVFEKVSLTDEYRKGLINKYRSLSDALRPGDRVKCSVFIVEKEKRNGVETAVINTNRRDIQSYAEFPLWLCPYDNHFERLEVDSRESLKFRKQWFYTSVNREKYEKITGSTLYSYRDKKWINKNPKMIFPVLWWIQAKTTISNLWEKFTSSAKIGIIVGILGLVATIIFGVISIIR